MSRTVRDSRLETRTQRDRLAACSDTYWRTLLPGRLHLGYRRKKKSQSGSWVVRRYVGQDERTRTLDDGSTIIKTQGRYKTKTLGLADDFSDSDGKAVLSYAEAQDLALASMMREEEQDGSITVSEAISRYLDALGARGKETHQLRQSANIFILPHLGEKGVRALKTSKINDWLNALAASPARTRGGGELKNNDPRARRCSANKKLTLLRAALNHAFVEGKVKSDAEWRRVKPFKNVEESRKDFLDLEQAKRLVNAANSDSGFRDIVRAALITGCRYAELCRLRIGDFKNGKLAVLKSKTGKPRHVRLTQEGETFFRQICMGRSEDEVMLPKRAGGAWKKSDQFRPMREACKRAKIKPLGIHQLRHTYASLALMNGMPMLVLARNLGHTDTRMVEKHYGHLTASFEDVAIRESAPTYGIVGRDNVRKLKG